MSETATTTTNVTAISPKPANQASAAEKPAAKKATAAKKKTTAAAKKPATAKKKTTAKKRTTATKKKAAPKRAKTATATKRSLGAGSLNGAMPFANPAAFGDLGTNFFADYAQGQQDVAQKATQSWEALSKSNEKVLQQLAEGAQKQADLGNKMLVELMTCSSADQALAIQSKYANQMVDAQIKATGQVADEVAKWNKNVAMPMAKQFEGLMDVWTKAMAV